MDVNVHDSTIRGLFSQIQTALDKNNEERLNEKKKGMPQQTAVTADKPTTVGSPAATNATQLHTPLFGGSGDGSQLHSFPSATVPHHPLQHGSSVSCLQEGSSDDCSDGDADSSTRHETKERTCSARESWQTMLRNQKRMQSAAINLSSSERQRSQSEETLDSLQSANQKFSFPATQFSLGSGSSLPSAVSSCRRRGYLTATPVSSQGQSNPFSPQLKPCENARGSTASTFSASSTGSTNLNAWIDSRRRNVGMKRSRLSSRKPKVLTWKKPTFQLGGTRTSAGESTASSTSNSSPFSVSVMSTSCDEDKSSTLNTRSHQALDTFNGPLSPPSREEESTVAGGFLGKRKNEDVDSSSIMETIYGMPSSNTNQYGHNNSFTERRCDRPPRPYPYGTKQYTEEETDSLVEFADKWMPTGKRRKLF